MINAALAAANLVFFPILVVWRKTRSLPGFLQRIQHSYTSLCTFLSARRWLVLILVLVLGVPPLLVLLMRDEIEIGSVPEGASPGNPVIAALLAGERLVPPPPLPPEAFSTVEVMAIRPTLVNASRDWALLNDDFAQRLLRVFQRMQEHGYEMVLIEGYRSPERQDQLAAMGNHVTNARSYQSYHQYGLAADCAFMRNGKLVISEKDPWAMRGYELYGREAEALGLTWGGRWKMMDFVHVELRAMRIR